MAARPIDENVVIDDVQYNGNSALAESDLDKVLEIGPGDSLDRKKVLDTSKNIQDLYRSKGYDEVGIQIQLVRKPIPKTKSFDHILEVSIKEGYPVRISQVQFSWPTGKSLTRLRAVEGRLGLLVGDTLDEEKLSRGFRSIQDALSAQDYMGAKVELKSVQITAPPESGVVSPEVIQATSKWVVVTVAVDVGERVTFGFQGNETLSHQALASLVEEQRLLGLSADYVSRIRARIEEEYRKLGYDLITIDPYTFESPVEQKRHVTFKIVEGPRVLIDNVVFDGNLFYSSEELETLFWENAVNPVSRHYFVETEVTKTAELVIERLKANGYLSAKLVSVGKTPIAEGSKVRLTVTINEGEQTVTESIVFDGLKVFTEDEIKKTLGIEREAPLNLYAFNEGLDRLKAMYRARGYYDLKIVNEGTSSVIAYLQENRRARIRLEFSEGQPSYVSRVQIEGNRKTRAEVISRELQLKDGDLLEEPKWLDSEARIRRLGIFSTVNIQAVPEPENPSRKVLRVKVEEGSPGVIAGGLGLRNDLGARIFGQVSYGNLWGKNHTATLTANANRRFGSLGSSFCASAKQKLQDPERDFCFIEFDVSLAYAYPYVFMGPTVFRPSISGERKQLQTRKGETFDVDTIALALTLERNLIRRPGMNLTTALTYGLENTRQYNAEEEVDNQRLRIGTLGPTIIFDRRDNSLVPTKGTYTTFTGEWASPYFLSQEQPIPVSYTRFQFRNDVIIPLPHDIGLFLSFRTGIEYNLAKPPVGSENDPRYAIPLVKLFALGGVNSVRGFREQSIGVDSSVAVRGYASYTNYRVQLDLPFSGNLRFGPFWDAANMKVDHYSLGNLIYDAFGFGFRYRSPVGPVNFDIGFNPNPRQGEDSYRLHFSIGLI